MDVPNSAALHDELAAESLVEQNTTIDIKLIETGVEGSAFRLSDLPGGEFQRSHIKQVEDSGLTLQVNQSNVVHGTYTPGGPRATLAIFRFRFVGSVSHGRRFRRVAITIRFALGEKPGDIQDPVVATIIPDGHFVLGRSVSHITETASGTLNASVPLNGSTLGASYTHQRAQVGEKETRATMFGIPLIRGRQFGESNSAKWVLNEDPQSRHGIPPAFNAAVLLQPQTAGNFRAFVNVDVEADFIYNTKSFFKRFFGAPDHPVTYNQNQNSRGSPLGFELDTQNLSAAVSLLKECIITPPESNEP